MSLEKLAALSAQGRSAPAGSADPAAELVTAIRRNLAEVRTYLAKGDDGEDGKPKKKGGSDSSDGDGDSDHSGHPTFKAMTKRGVDEAKARSMCAKADNRTKVAACAEQAELLLAALDSAPGDWVEATAEDHLGAVALSGAPAGGAGAFADPGYLGKRRFRIDTEESTRLSLAYTSQPVRMSSYTAEQQGKIAARVKLAAARFRLALPQVGEQAAAAEVRSALFALTGSPAAMGSLDEAAEAFALAAKPIGDGGIPMNHGPFNGTHVHTHFQSAAHAHPHQHANDNQHNGGPLHRPGSQPKYGRGDW